MRVLFHAAVSRPIATSALQVALFVGTVLNLINQGPTIYAGSDPSWVILIMNFMVPYCVASYSGAKVQVRRGLSP